MSINDDSDILGDFLRLPGFAVQLWIRPDSVIKVESEGTNSRLTMDHGPSVTVTLRAETVVQKLADFLKDDEPKPEPTPMQGVSPWLTWLDEVFPPFGAT